MGIPPYWGIPTVLVQVMSAMPQSHHAILTALHRDTALYGDTALLGDLLLYEYFLYPRPWFSVIGLIAHSVLLKNQLFG